MQIIENVAQFGTFILYGFIQYYYQGVVLQSYLRWTNTIVNFFLYDNPSRGRDILAVCIYGQLLWPQIF